MLVGIDLMSQTVWLCMTTLNIPMICRKSRILEGGRLLRMLGWLGSALKMPPKPKVASSSVLGIPLLWEFRELRVLRKIRRR